MSDVFTKRRPMIDLDEFERRLSRPSSTDQKGGDVLAELLRVIGDKDAPHKTDFEPKTQLSEKVQLAGETADGKQPDAQVRSAGGDFAAIEAGLVRAVQPQAAILREAESPTVEHKRSTARAPLISGDFAAIEAGLLGTPREQATAMVPETGIANPFPNLDLRSEHTLYRDEPPASGQTNVAADEHIRSRRPLYVMMATIIVGMAGIAVSVGFNSRLSDSSDIALVKADNAPDNQAVQAPSGADAPTQDAAILGNPPEPSPTPLENGAKQPLDLTQAEERPSAAIAPIESASPVESESAAVPPVAPRAQTPAEPFGVATPVESEKVGQPPQADVKAAPPSASQSPASAKTPTAKTGGRIALKPAAAKHSGGKSHPRQIANKAKATPATPPATEPTPSAGRPTADTPTAQPSPANNGPFGLVQSAVDSLTSATAKLLQGGRN
jgi:hypothetical protein